MPIYTPGSLPRIGEASALARQRGYEAQDKELATLTSARIAFARRQATAEQYTQLVARIRELRETMRGFGIERAAGFRTVLDELNIRGELANAEVAAEIVLNERDGQALQLAAAAASSTPRPAGLLSAVRVGRSPAAVGLRRSLAGAPVEKAPALRGSGAPGGDADACSARVAG